VLGTRDARRERWREKAGEAESVSLFLDRARTGNAGKWMRRLKDATDVVAQGCEQVVEE